MLAVEVETSANGYLDYDKLALYSSLPKVCFFMVLFLLTFWLATPGTRSLVKHLLQSVNIWTLLCAVIIAGYVSFVYLVWRGKLIV